MQWPVVFSSVSKEGREVRIILSLDGHVPEGRFHSFQNDSRLRYHPYCDDFGPMNMTSTIYFIKLLDEAISKCAAMYINDIIYFVDSGRRALSNAVMLLGSYMILKHDVTPRQALERFAWIGRERLEDFRDATDMPPDFGLTLHDCWSGLYRGKQVGWIARQSSLDDPCWGEIDMEQYDHYDDPLEADLVEVVPNKLIAFRGPIDLGGVKYVDDPQLWSRRFGPEHFAEVLPDLGVTDVVRLNSPEYDAGVFAAAGIRHHDLFFEDCTEPPGDVVAAFFRIVDSARGVVAVHCLAGLGRTGTLIALCMMRSHGFTARAAMGWLRIMRPGSVIGEQQHFLCTVQRLRERPAAARRAMLTSSQSAGDVMLAHQREKGGLLRTASGPVESTGTHLGVLRSSASLGGDGDRERGRAAQEAAQQVAAAMGAQSAARARARQGDGGRPAGSPAT